MQAFEQQDVEEMSKILFDALEMKFKDTPQAGLVISVHGRSEDYVRCKVCGNKSARTDAFTDLKITVRPFGRQSIVLEEGLQSISTRAPGRATSTIVIDATKGC